MSREFAPTSAQEPSKLPETEAARALNGRRDTSSRESLRKWMSVGQIARWLRMPFRLRASCSGQERGHRIADALTSPPVRTSISTSGIQLPAVFE